MFDEIAEAPLEKLYSSPQYIADAMPGAAHMEDGEQIRKLMEEAIKRGVLEEVVRIIFKPGPFDGKSVTSTVNGGERICTPFQFKGE